jgi:benzoylformate decarboxylase
LQLGYGMVAWRPVGNVPAMPRTGRDALLEVLRTEGVRHIFGNPGSTELPLMDALATADDLHYVLALQEATAVGMADGYAQATGRPAFLNLHTSAGLGNAVGNLTNAQANQTPLVVTAGQQDERHLAADPLLAGDLVGLAQPVSKWAHEVRNLDELGTIVRRAFHDATAPPPGPVFVSIRMSTLDEEGEAPVPVASRIERRSVAASLDDLANLLTAPAVGKLAIVVGDEVSASGAVEAVARLAEVLGAPVYASPLHSTGVFPAAHPLWAGMLLPAAAAIRATLSAYERVLLIGGRAFMVYPYSDGSPLPEGTELIQLSPDPASLGRTYPVVLGVAGDPRLTIEALLPLVGAKADVAAAGDAVAQGRQRRATDIANLEATARERYGPTPMDPMAVSHALVRSMPDDVIVVDEAITTGGYVRGFHHWTEPGRYYFCKGGGLGWAMPAALGVSLAHAGEAPVLCVVGDGSAMYSPQALWTAAHEGLPVVFAVVNNRQYLILKNNLRGMKGAAAESGRFVAMDIVDPPVDYVGLATALGVASTRIDQVADIGDAVGAALASGGPHLLELPISTPA